jgi:hypothetical protein
MIILNVRDAAKEKCVKYDVHQYYKIFHYIYWVTIKKQIHLTFYRVYVGGLKSPKSHILITMTV